MDETQAAVQSIGEYTVDMIGKANLSGLQVTLNPREHSAFMLVSLRDNADVSQREAIRALLDVEGVFAEVSLAYVFVHDIPAIDAEHLAPQFSYA